MAVLSKTLLVITTYNQSEYTKLCFESLKKIDDDIDVLVIDDCSTDDTVDICNEYGVEVITKSEGMGLTDSWNRGYSQFKSKKYDYLILANNDILIPKGAINELVEIFERWPFSLIVPTSTTYGVGHNREQSIENYFKGFDFTNPDACQYIQDTIIEAKNQAKKSNSLFVFDPVRMKMFNGFFFMMNRNIIKYEHSDTELFEPKYIMTKNEDEFNWGKLIPNNDFAALCKTSFIFHYKGVSTFEVFDNYGEISNDVSEWKKQRKLKGG